MLRRLKYVSGSPMHSLIIQRIRFGKADVHTVVTLTDNASQGVNEAFSSFFTDGTQVPSASKARPLCVFNSLRGRAAIHAHLQRLRKTFRHHWPRSLRWSPPNLPYGLPRPPRHNFIQIIISEGNLVNEPDNANTTALLVSTFAWDDGG